MRLRIPATGFGLRRDAFDLRRYASARDGRDERDGDDGHVWAMDARMARAAPPESRKLALWKRCDIKLRYSMRTDEGGCLYRLYSRRNAWLVAVLVHTYRRARTATGPQLFYR